MRPWTPPTRSCIGHGDECGASSPRVSPGVQHSSVTDPTDSLSDDAREALISGGLDPSPISGREPDAIARTERRLASLIAEAADAEQIAHDLGVSSVEVERLAADRALFAIRDGGTWRFPRFQFGEDGRPLPGLAVVAAALPDDIHPVAAWRFLTEPVADLEIDDDAVAPLDWLRAGRAPDRPADIAHDL